LLSNDFLDKVVSKEKGNHLHKHWTSSLAEIGKEREREFTRDFVFVRNLVYARHVCALLLDKKVQTRQM